MKIWIDDTAHALRQKVTVLGRDPSADIPVVHAEVSRKHSLILSVGEDRYMLLDFKSANGTRLNGHRVECAELRDGDRIDLAGAILTVEHHRRRGSLSATGRYKTLLELESATGEDQSGHTARLFSDRLEELSRVLPRLEGLRRAENLDDAALATLDLNLLGLGADRGLLLLLDEDGASLRLRAEVGFAGGRGVRKNLHQVLLDEAVDNDRIVTTGPDYMREVFSALRTQQGGRVDVAGSIAAPLTVCGRPIGALCLDRNLGGAAFRAHDRAMLRFLTQVCASHLATLLLRQQVVTQFAQLEIQEVVLQQTGLGNCEVCGEGLASVGAPIVRCSECHTQFHEDCWAFLGKCAIFACESHLATRVPGGSGG